MAMRFAGFNGRPVAESVGIKAALTFDQESRQYGIVRAGQLDARWSQDEMVELEKRGLVSLLATDRPYEEDAVAFYAHMRFVVPGTADLFSLRRERIDELELYPALESYVAFVSPSRAQEIMRRWTSSLLQAARAAFDDSSMDRERRGRNGFLEAMRARLASPPSSGRPGDRLEAFALAWIGLSWQQQNQEALLRDAARDGLRAETIQRATELLPTLTSQAPMRSHRDAPPTPHRRCQDAA
jgi:hypothetical protein